MDFFAAQAAARRRTRWLLAAYALAVAVVVAALTYVVVVVLVALGNDGLVIAAPGPWWREHVGITVFTALVVLGVIGVAALHRMAQLRGGGGAVARALGGTKVTRETQDPKRRRLLNVVEEVAIASGVPVPEVYVLEQETAINAFAAGYLPTDAAIAVTRGALERLNRAELQGVIGHEFSHVLNGDMRLNTRLAGPLFGLLVIAIAARHLLRGLGRSRSGRKAGLLMVAVLAVMALGYLGVQLGRLLQAAICRQREFLADAASVQFTRDTTGLRDALVKIGRGERGSAIDTAEGEDLAHLFLAPAYRRLFGTHPPLAARIRALDGRFDLALLDRPLVEEPMEVLDVESLADAPAHGARAFAPEARVPVEPERMAARVANPGLDEVAYAAALRGALPADLDAALARGTTAAVLWLAIGLATDPAVAARQLALVRARLGDTVATAVERFAARVRALPLVQRLPLLQRALPALAALPRERRDALVELSLALARADGRIDALEYLLGALAARYLADQVGTGVRPARSLGLADAKEELGTVFATLAHHGHDDGVAARRAYERGLQPLLPRERPEYRAPAGDGWQALDAALARLDALAPVAKELLVEGLARTVVHDGTVRVREAELLRATCALLHVPLPPLLGGDAAG